MQEFIGIIQRTTVPPYNELRSYLEMGTQDFLFSAKADFQSDLKEGILSPTFLKEFKEHGIALSARDKPTITTEAEGRRWRIFIPPNRMLVAIIEGGELNIYELRQRWERARWIDGERLERDLAGYLDYEWCLDSPDQVRSITIEAIARRSSAFVALVDDDRRFLALVDRYALLDQLRKEQGVDTTSISESNAS